MIIEPESNGVRRSQRGAKHILVYKDKKIILAEYEAGITVTTHNMEVFDNAQNLVDRALELGLDFTIGHILSAAEYGVPIRDDIFVKLNSIVWDMGDIYVSRMEALGYER